MAAAAITRARVFGWERRKGFHQLFHMGYRTMGPMGFLWGVGLQLPSEATCVPLAYPKRDKRSGGWAIARWGGAPYNRGWILSRRVPGKELAHEGTGIGEADL